jgi:hypothetical protein
MVAGRSLTDIAISAGDTVRLQLINTGQFGDFVGVNLAITLVPEPSVTALAILAAALGCARFIIRLRSTRALHAANELSFLSRSEGERSREGLSRDKKRG